MQCIYPRYTRKSVAHYACKSALRNCSCKILHHPFWCYRSRGINSDPAPVLKPDLSPCMGIRLTNFKIAVHVVEISTLIACNDTCWYFCCSHEIDEGTRIMFTKPSTAFKQKIIHTIYAKKRRL